MIRVQEGGTQMPYPIDQTSYQLGVIFAFAEMVAIDLKKMAFSLPFSPGDHNRLVKDAKRIVREQGVRMKLEKRILTTDLFPEEFTRGKWVFIIYKHPEVLKNYFRLKSEKERLLRENSYKGRERKGIAVGLGKLLSYKRVAIEKKLKKAAK
jgi:hypothetical protein